MKSLLNKSHLLAVVAVITLTVLLTGSAKAVNSDPADSNALFDHSRVHSLYIKMDPTDWDTMRFDCPGGQCPWGNADIEPPDYYAEMTCGDWVDLPVAIHRKNDPGLPDDINPQKFSMKIDTNRWITDQKFAGKSKLDLENGSQTSPAQEGYAWQIYERTGMVSPKVSWIKVYISTNDGASYDYKGLFVNVEQVDKEFLKDHDVNNSGWLYKMENFGESQRTHETNPFEPNPFKFRWYPFDHEADATLTTQPVDWLTQAQWRVDMDHLIKLAVAENFAAGTDALVMKGTNYWFYDWSTNPLDYNDPAYQQPRLYFAWDLDAAMKTQQTSMSITNNLGGNFSKGLINELDGNSNPYPYHTFKGDYLSTYKSMIDGPLAQNTLLAEVNAIQVVYGPAITADPYGGGTAQFDTLRTFINNRFASVKAQLDAVAPLPGTFLLNDGFEGATWDANWNDTAHTWARATDLKYSGTYSAKKAASSSGTFTSDPVNTSDANAIYIRFWYNLDDTEGTDITFSYYNGTSYVAQPAIADGAEDTWLCYTATITDSQFFKTNFRIQFNATLGNGENVWIDGVEITKTLPPKTLTSSSTAGGDVTTPGEGAFQYDHGTYASIVATPESNYHFVNWTGTAVTAGKVTDPNAASTTVLMDADYTVTANFAADVVQRSLTSSSGDGGNVTTPGEGVNSYSHGTVVDLVATSDLNYHFVSWTGTAVDAGKVASPTSATTTVTMDADYTVVANFAIDTFTLTYTAGENGSIAGTTPQTVDYGTSGTAVTAEPALGYHFVKWSDDSTVNPRTDTGVTASIAVTASFAQSQFTISGTITCAGLAVEDVNLVGLGVVTDVNGFYGATVAGGWSGTATPVKDGYTFDPNSRVYTDVAGDLADQNYAALPSDNFNDNRRGSMWRLMADGDSAKSWVTEDGNRLNEESPGWAPLISFCTGHWKMNDDEPNTMVLDYSGTGHNGTAQQNTSDLNTTGKIDGALTFNGTTDYVNVGNIIGTGAYTKVAWVKRDDGNYYNNIIASGDPWSHAFYAPSVFSFKLTAWHAPYSAQYIVQDSEALRVGVWYFVAVTYDPNVDSGTLVLYKNGVKIDDANHVPTLVVSPNTYIGRFSTGYNFKGAIDNVMTFNKALTAGEITSLYNEDNGTEDLAGSGQYQASYTSNGWNFDIAEDFAVKVDYHYSDISMAEGWIGMNVGDDANYVSISAGSDGNQTYFYYEAAVDGEVVFERQTRTSSNGTLYISYDATTKDFYLSHTGFGSENAYVWTAPNPTEGQWAQPVNVSIGGGSSGAAVSPGEAYTDNFEMAKAGLLDWPPATDLDNSGYIEIYDLKELCENWLGSGEGDFDGDGNVDLFDLAEFGLAW